MQYLRLDECTGKAMCRLALACAFVLVVVLPAFSQDLAQRYRIEGTNAFGEGQYRGIVALARSGDVYQVAWSVGAQAYVGTGLMEGRVLSVVYAADTTAPGIAVYRIEPDGRLVGRWVGLGGQAVGEEVWIPHGGTQCAAGGGCARRNPCSKEVEMTAQWQPVTHHRHAKLVWHGPKTYANFSSIITVPLSASELSFAVRSLPMGFVDLDGHPTLMAVLGILPGENLFVAPDGRWLAGYAPAALRAYPFRLGHIGEADQFALMVDEASGLITKPDAGLGETPFFNDDGQPAEQTRKVLDFLIQVHKGQRAAARASGLLEEMGLLADWPLKAEQDGEVREVAGVRRVDEAALGQLDGDQLVRLRDEGALALAYIQLVSMANLNQLAALSRARRQVEQKQAEQMTIPPGSFIDEDDDEMKIDWDTLLGDKQAV